MKSTGMRAQLPDGRALHAIVLRTEDGRWLGDVVLEYDDANGWGRLYSITDYGDYGHCWHGVPRTPTHGFEAFVASMDPDYLVGKLAQGHDEERVCDVDATAAALEKIVLARWGEAESEDAEYLGDALDGLRRAEDERGLWAWQSEHPQLSEPEDVYRGLTYRRGGLLAGYREAVVPALQAYLREVPDGGTA